HGRARRRNDHVPAVHLEAERHRRAAHKAREAPLVERMAGQALVLVVEPAEPRRRVVRPAGADAVELHEVAVHVRLEDRAADPEHLAALAHEEDEARPGVVHAVDVVRSLEDHLEPPRLEMLARQTQDLGVVRLPPRRMRNFPEDAPAGRALHACPPRKSYDTRPAKASASAIATSPARSTSTTVSTTSPKSGPPAWQSQPRNSRSRPSSAGATRVRTRSDTRYIPAVTRPPAA